MDRALALAAGDGHAEQLQDLLDAPGVTASTVNTANELGLTPLHRSARAAHVRCVELLIAHGAALNARDMRQETPLDWAAWKGRDGVVEVLLKAGADLHTRNNEGNTALHWAAKKGHVACVALLLEYGAKTQLRNHDGKSPADVASSAEIRNLLVSKREVVFDDAMFRSLSDADQDKCKDFRCPVCHVLRVDVKQCTREGHVVCTGCSQRLTSCPFNCGATGFQMDYRLQRELRSLDSTCVFGCGWRGALKDVHGHLLEECERSVVACTACGEQMPVAEWRDHSSDACPLRRVQCTFCDKRVAWKHVDEHVADMHQECPMPDCGFRGSTQQLQQHVAEQGVVHLRELVQGMNAMEQRLTARIETLEREGE